jgi:hypothetical protein
VDTVEFIVVFVTSSYSVVLKSPVDVCVSVVADVVDPIIHTGAVMNKTESKRTG